MGHRRDQRSDTELLAAVRDRDRGALNELYRRHESWLTTRLSYRCSDRGAVEEAVQDTFVKVWNMAGKYDGSGEVAAWIWGIGIRTLLHRIRPRKSLLERLASQDIVARKLVFGTLQFTFGDRLLDQVVELSQQRFFDDGG